MKFERGEECVREYISNFFIERCENQWMWKKGSNTNVWKDEKIQSISVIFILKDVKTSECGKKAATPMCKKSSNTNVWKDEKIGEVFIVSCFFCVSFFCYLIFFTIVKKENIFLVSINNFLTPHTLLCCHFVLFFFFLI